MKFEWVDELPPPIVGGRKRLEEYDKAIEQLKAHPGQWALVDETVKQTTPGTITALRRRGARTSTRKQPDGKYRHYASWPGEEEQW